MPNIPLLGEVPKGGLVAGGLAAVAVGGYLYIRHQKTKAAEAATGATGYGYGASAYGYGESVAGYYGYGYGYGAGGQGGFSPYPFGSSYGYGAFGYGYYNPYTGQFLGPPPSPAPVPTGGTGGTQGGQGSKPGTHTNTAPGTLDLYYLATLNGITESVLLKLNPNLRHLLGSKKPVPRGTKVKV